VAEAHVRRFCITNGSAPACGSQMLACYDFPCYNRFRVP